MPPRPQVSVFIATSLDGFIARPDGSLDWLEAANRSIPPGEDCGYGAFMAGVDTLVMGRKTFETVSGFPEWPYPGKRVIVLSTQADAVPAAFTDRATRCAAAPEALLAELAITGARHIYLDGGVTIQNFLRAGLVDDITITLIPLLLGAGRPLFGGLEAIQALTLTASRAYPFGFVQNSYRVIRD